MKLDDKYKLNLQFFAEDGEGDSGKDNDDKVPENDDDNPNKERFTQSEVDSQISKAVETALSKRERKHRRTKAKRKLKEYEKREKALAEKEKQFKLRELKADVESDLKEKVCLLRLLSLLFI